MYGYGSGDENIVCIPETSIWDLSGSLEHWASEQETVEVEKCCATPQELLKSESFGTFLHIFNAICARDAQQTEMYGRQPTTGESMLRDKFTRDRAYNLWQKLQIKGKVNAIRGLDDQLQKWMTQLDEIEGKEKEVQIMRNRIGA